MKNKTRILISVALIVITVVGLIAIANFLGIGTMRSATAIGYVSNDGWRNWSASYTMLDGTLTHTIRPKDTQEKIHVEVVTEGGSITIEMKDADGNVIFNEDIIETSAFDVKVSGKVVVRIEADKHKGSFNIEAAE